MTEQLVSISAEERVKAAQEMTAEEKRRLLAELLAKKATQPQVHPTSFGQERLWFMEQLEGGGENSAYNIIIALGLRGDLDVAVLKQSLNEIIRRHAVLRTTYKVDEDGNPVAVIAPKLTIELPLIDMIDADEETVQAFLTKQVDHPFELETGPLVRAHLLQRGIDDYALVWVVHHTIFDGFSASIWTKELSALYPAFLVGEPSPLPELPIQYHDYARRQRKEFSGERMQKQLDYWKNELAGAPPLITLPTDHPRPPVQTTNGAIYRKELSRELTEKLKQLSQKTGTTLFTTLYSAFAVLLARYSGQNDVVIGTAVTHRSHPQLESMIGFLVNMIALRTDISDDPTFSTLLKRVQQTVRQGLIHQDLPFEKLVSALDPERNMSHAPITQVSISWTHKFIDPGSGFGGLTTRPLPVSSTTAQRDLSLLLLELDETVVSTWEYNTDLFDRETIERIVSHFVTLLESIVAQPDQPVLQLPMLTVDEYHQIVQTWNETAAEGASVHADAPQPIHSLFEQQVERTPDALAVVAGEETEKVGDWSVTEGESPIANLQPPISTLHSLTYAELNARANQLAHHLIALGVQADTPVVVAMHRSVDLIVSLLAILKAGGAYVPVDPTYPAERIQNILTDSRAPIVLSQASHLARCDVDYGDCYVLAIDADWAHLAQQPTHNPHRQMSMDDLIYIIYTSGSTGQPKGVAVKHRGFANLLHWFVNAFQLNGNDSVLLISSPGFDLTQKNIYAPLLVGGCLYLTHEYDPKQIVDLIARHAITWINCTPSAFYPLIESYDWPVSRLRSLRYLFLGGEPIAVARLQRWMQDPSYHARIVNTYGPTECTDIGAAYTIPSGFAAETVPIGRPTYNVQLYILDSKVQPTPIGVVGELYIGGIQVARGYLNRPELTAERFITHPDFGRLYKTGDLCRWLPDGTIEYMGRADFQVKIRGFRVELGEIESALLAQAGVREAIVLARTDDGPVGAGPRLVAYLVCEDETETNLNVEALRLALAQRLPEYMVPTAFVRLDAMPLSANGKVNRHALPAPDYTEAQHTYVAPRDELELILTVAFAEALKLPQIGIYDNFFHMGGDSILILQLVSRVTQKGYMVRVKDLFEHPTVAQLAAAIHAKDAAELPQTVASQDVQTGQAPLLPIQRWFLETNHAEMHHSNQPFLLVVKQPIARAQLETALKALLLHHDALRLQFYLDKTGWHQRYLAPSAAVPLDVVDLSGVAPQDRPTHIEAIGTQTQTRLDPLTGAVARFVYFDTGGNDGADAFQDRLLVALHHLVTDGVSRRILMEDLATLLDGGQLPPKTSSYRDWATALQTATQNGQFDGEIAAWLEDRLAGALSLPLDEPAARNTIGDSHHLQCTLSQTQTAHLLRTVPAAYGVSLDAIIITALTETLTTWSGQPGLRIKLESYGRHELFDAINLNRTVGWFTATCPLTIPSVAGSAATKMRATQARLDRITDGGISFGALRYFHPDAELRRQLMELPAPTVMYNNFSQLATLDHPRFADAPESPGIRVSPRNRRDRLIDNDLLITDGGLYIGWTVSPQLHRRTAEALLDQFVQTIDALLAEALENN